MLTTIARKGKAQSVAQDVMARVFNGVEEDWLSFVRLPLTDEVLAAARALAKNLGLRAADTVHLASALVLK